MDENFPKEMQLFGRLLLLLEEKRFPDQLRWVNREEGLFELLLMNKRNPKWNPSFLDLYKFQDNADAKKFATYIKDPKYERKCKERFRSNLRKMTTGKTQYLSLCPDKGDKDKHSRTVKRYRLCFPVSDIPKVLKQLCKKKKRHARKVKSTSAKENTMNGLPDSSDTPSHYSCLSVEDRIPLAIHPAIPQGQILILSVIPLEALQNDAYRYQHVLASPNNGPTCGVGNQAVGLPGNQGVDTRAIGTTNGTQVASVYGDCHYFPASPNNCPTCGVGNQAVGLPGNQGVDMRAIGTTNGTQMSSVYVDDHTPPNKCPYFVDGKHPDRLSDNQEVPFLSDIHDFFNIDITQLGFECIKSLDEKEANFDPNEILEGLLTDDFLYDDSGSLGEIEHSYGLNHALELMDTSSDE